jgi:hypothetical protein
MSVLKRRSRMISFRVSEDEYVGLKNLCVNEGARSVSDMARDAVQRLITNHSWPNNQLATVVQMLQDRVDTLDKEVKRLGQALHGTAATVNGNARNGNADL